MQYTKFYWIGALILLGWYTVFATEWQTPEEKMAQAIKAQNEAISQRNQLSLQQFKRSVTDCYNSAEGTEEQKVTRFTQCSNIPMPKLQEYISTGSINNESVDSASGGIIPEPSQSWSKQSWSKKSIIREDYQKTPDEKTCSDFPMKKVKYVVLHYTDSSPDITAKAIENGHTWRWWLKTYTSAYHYLIENDGNIVRPRSETCGSLALSEKATMQNDETINISYIGNTKPNAKQLESLKKLVRDIQNRYWLSRDAVTAHWDIQSKNKQETMEWMFGSKADFVKMLREQDKVTIYGKESPELTYMWQAWGDKDFIGTIFQESRFNTSTIGDGGSSIWYCQIHKEYQPEWYAEYSKLTTMADRLNYCNEKYTQEISKYGSHWKYFHWYYKKDKHISNLVIQ